MFPQIRGTVHHGPHPKAFETIKQRDTTNEVAILIETTRSLWPTPEAEKSEAHAYATNWAVPPADARG